jgi:predicted TIM-barrel fold metal-dependent hydrolase
MVSSDLAMRRRFSRRKKEWVETDFDREAFEETLSDATLVDNHFHVHPYGEGGPHDHEDRMDAVERIIDWMDETGIDRIVLQPLESPEGSKGYLPTWWALEVADAYPERVIPFCSVDPRFNTWEGYDWFADRIDHFVDRGARGFGELKIGMPIDDTRLQMLYDICAERDLPILFHLDGSHATDDVGLPGLERMVRKFPDLDFVMHAHGWWAHISGDVTASDTNTYPDGPVTPGGRVDYFLEEYDNVYGDISAGSGFNALTRDPEYGQEFLERHHEKLVWGSDVAGPTGVPQFAFFERFDLEPRQWENIRFRNIEGILREP